jgi:hypothetical protein
MVRQQLETVNMWFKKEVLYYRLRTSRDHAYGFEKKSKMSWKVFFERFAGRWATLERTLSLTFYLYFIANPFAFGRLRNGELHQSAIGLVIIAYLFLLIASFTFGIILIFSSGGWIAGINSLYHSIQVFGGSLVVFKYEDTYKVQAGMLLLLMCRLWNWNDSSEITFTTFKNVEPLAEVETVTIFYLEHGVHTRRLTKAI